MDLVAGVKRVVVIMDQCAKDGSSKLLHRCTLPLTGSGVIDMVITNLGVFEIDKVEGHMVLVELADDVTLDEIRTQTEANYTIAEGLQARAA